MPQGFYTGRPGAVAGLVPWWISRWQVRPALLGLAAGRVAGAVLLAAACAALLALFHAFVVGYEEPTLRRTHGAEYERFRANVPRWVPRVTPWRGGG